MAKLSSRLRVRGKAGVAQSVFMRIHLRMTCVSTSSWKLMDYILYLHAVCSFPVVIVFAVGHLGWI
jgi:hypothetical protein